MELLAPSRGALGGLTSASLGRGSEGFTLKGLFHPWAQWDRGPEFENTSQLSTIRWTSKIDPKVGVPMAPFGLKPGQNEPYGLQGPFKTPPGPETLNISIYPTHYFTIFLHAYTSLYHHLFISLSLYIYIFGDIGKNVWCGDPNQNQQQREQ